ncbi:hypothetical protein BHE74_00041771, partial [Ensete ventricosum]
VARIVGGGGTLVVDRPLFFMSLGFSLSSFPPFCRKANLLLIPASRPLMAPTKVVAEYAKSGRSACNSCSKAIAAGALRLGSSSKGPRGFDLVRWFHVDCFPTASLALAAADEIVGFSSLKVRPRLRCIAYRDFPLIFFASPLTFLKCNQKEKRYIWRKGCEGKHEHIPETKRHIKSLKDHMKTHT